MNKQPESNGDGDLSRLYRSAAQPEPPPALDAAILAASRRAAGARPRRAQSLRRWEVPLALAATVLLTVSVTLLVHEERPYGDSGAPPPALPDRSSARQNTESAAKPAYVPAPPGAAGPAARPAPAPEKAAAALPATGRADTVVPPALQVAPATAGRPAAGVAPAEAGANTGRIAEPASAPAAAPAPAAAMRAPAPAMMEKRALSSSPPEQATMDGLARDEKSPERWIVEIRELRRAGRAAEAADKLAEFSKRFPGHPLPDDLK